MTVVSAGLVEYEKPDDCLKRTESGSTSGSVTFSSTKTPSVLGDDNHLPGTNSIEQTSPANKLQNDTHQDPASNFVTNDDDGIDALSEKSPLIPTNQSLTTKPDLSAFPSYDSKTSTNYLNGSKSIPHYHREVPPANKNLKRKRPRTMSPVRMFTTLPSQEVNRSTISGRQPTVPSVPTDSREDMKAAARAYALSCTTTTTRTKTTNTNVLPNNTTTGYHQYSIQMPYNYPQSRAQLPNQQSTSSHMNSNPLYTQQHFNPLLPTTAKSGTVPVYNPNNNNDTNANTPSQMAGAKVTNQTTKRQRARSRKVGVSVVQQAIYSQPPPHPPPYIAPNTQATSYTYDYSHQAAWKQLPNPSAYNSSTKRPLASNSVAHSYYPPIREATTPTIQMNPSSKATNSVNRHTKNQKIIPVPPTAVNMFVDEVDDNLDEYELFVKFLGLENIDEGYITTKMKDDDDDEFVLDPLDEDDDEEEDDLEDEVEDIETESTFLRSAVRGTADGEGNVDADEGSVDESAWGPDFSRELAEELGWLEEEDMEAAVATLLDQPYRHYTNSAGEESSSNSPAFHFSSPAIVTPPTPASNASPSSEAADFAFATKDNTPSGNDSLSTAFSPPGSSKTRDINECRQSRQIPLSFSASKPKPRAGPPSSSRSASVTVKQYEQLQQLLEKHYQLLIQQAVLAVRAAHSQKVKRSLPPTLTPMVSALDNNASLTAPHMESLPDPIDFVTSGETADDLVEILDGAVGMLQDLGQNRKDAIRLFVQFNGGSTASFNAKSDYLSCTSTRKTKRSLLHEPVHYENNRIHDEMVPPQGAERRLTRAQFTKTLLEQTNGQHRTVFDIKGITQLTDTFNLIDKSVEEVRLMNGNNCNILELPTNFKACCHVLENAGAKIYNDFVPGSRDVSLNFVDAREFFGEDFKAPCTRDQEFSLKRNRNLFTSGEDNLVLRGVNLYGEKQWVFIADRFLPDRSINIIAQRYSKLCYMLYKAHGVQIDDNGNLATPPKLESADDLDENEVSKLTKVNPPALLNVHRWSLEEDITLLKAVPVMGFMWAELKARLVPHRDRGHLRKRYQVLERRVKATAARLTKLEICASNVPPPLTAVLQLSNESSPPLVIAKRPSSSRSAKKIAAARNYAYKVDSTQKSKETFTAPAITAPAVTAPAIAAPAIATPAVKVPAFKPQSAPTFKLQSAPTFKLQSAPTFKLQSAPTFKLQSPPTFKPQSAKSTNIHESKRKIASRSTSDTRAMAKAIPEAGRSDESTSEVQNYTQKSPRAPNSSVVQKHLQKTPHVSSHPLPPRSYVPPQPPLQHRHLPPPLNAPASAQHYSPSRNLASPSHPYHPPTIPHHMIPYPHHPYAPPPSHLTPGYHIHPYMYHHPYHPAPPHYPPPHHPYPPHPHHMHPNPDETSRSGYEKLVHEPSQEWSRMSELDKAIEEEEVTAASTIVSQLARSPKKRIKPESQEKDEATRDSFADKNFEEGASGLTMLEEFRSSPSKATTPAEQATESVSFLAGVLERSGHNSRLAEIPETSIKSLPQTRTPEVEESKKSKSELEPPTPPATKAALFCSPGTSFGMSPGFPMFKCDFSRDTTLADNQDHDESHDHVTLDTFPGQSIDSYDINNVFHNSSRSLASRLYGNSSSANNRSTSAKTELFGDEFEVISALNALSSSPAKSAFSSSTVLENSQSETNSLVDTEKDTQEKSKKQKSLFEKVVENSKEQKRTPQTSNAKTSIQQLFT